MTDSTLTTICERLEAVEAEAEKLRTARDAEICAARNRGMTATDIAAATGLSRMQVHRVLRPA